MFPRYSLGTTASTHLWGSSDTLHTTCGTSTRQYASRRRARSRGGGFVLGPAYRHPSDSAQVVQDLESAVAHTLARAVLSAGRPPGLSHKVRWPRRGAPHRGSDFEDARSVATVVSLAVDISQSGRHLLITVQLSDPGEMLPTWPTIQPVGEPGRHRSWEELRLAAPRQDGSLGASSLE
jgi:hypothetical protein